MTDQTPDSSAAPAGADPAAPSVPDPLEKLGKGVVLVAFGAPWCTPFLLADGLLQDIEAAGGDVRRVDIEDWPQHAEAFRVVSLPTFVSVRSGTEKERTIGAVSRLDLFRLAGLKKPKR